ncbi:MAG: zinc-dependent peptidase [Phycisphaerales bacterium]
MFRWWSLISQGIARRQGRRERWRATPFSPAWREIVARNVAYVRLLDEHERRELEGHAQVFLHEKRFEGCAGLGITDEIRVTIATQACILLLGRETEYYPSLRTILVYPSRYVVDAKSRQPDGVIIEGPQVRSGESWNIGALVLAWDEARRGAMAIGDGQNLILHEFAHQLDDESGSVDGAPRLERMACYATWARVLGREYERLTTDLAQGRPTLLGRYAATNPAEFFAVATELFFERPLHLRGEHPALYDQLRGFYRQDPAGRLEMRRASG